MKRKGSVKGQLINMYGQICFLRGPIDDKKSITYHHIKPVREGRITTIDNGALLSLQMHRLFNRIEYLDPDFAEKLNRYFIYYKKTQDEKARLHMYKKVISYYFKLIKDDPKELRDFQKSIFNNG